MKYSLKNLNYLTAVARFQSFSKAAAACNVTQSTLSLGIQELERQMDVILFERTRKNIIPTAAGTTAIAHAKNILELSSTLEQEMTNIKNPNAGPLRIGVIPTIAPFLLPTALPVMEQAFPDSALQISEDTTQTILSKIRAGQTDLGIIALPVDTKDLESRVLFEEPFILSAHRDFQIPTPLTTISLAHIDLLLLRDGHCLKDHIIQACKFPKHKQNQFFEAESLHTLLAMVNQGYGATLVPRMAIDAGIVKPFTNIITKSFEQKPPSRHIGLVWRRSDLRAGAYLKLDFG